MIPKLIEETIELEHVGWMISFHDSASNKAIDKTISNEKLKNNYITHNW